MRIWFCQIAVQIKHLFRSNSSLSALASADSPLFFSLSNVLSVRPGRMPRLWLALGSSWPDLTTLRVIYLLGSLTISGHLPDYHHISLIWKGMKHISFAQPLLLFSINGWVSVYGASTGGSLILSKISSSSAPSLVDCCYTPKRSKMVQLSHMNEEPSSPATDLKWSNPSWEAFPTWTAPKAVHQQAKSRVPVIEDHASRNCCSIFL